jgi:hypothetical protein
MTTDATLSPFSTASTGGGCTKPEEGEVEDFDRQSWMISVTLAVFAAIMNNLG